MTKLTPKQQNIIDSITADGRMWVAETDRAGIRTMDVLIDKGLLTLVKHDRSGRWYDLVDPKARKQVN